MSFHTIAARLESGMSDILAAMRIILLGRLRHSNMSDDVRAAYLLRITLFLYLSKHAEGGTLMQPPTRA